MPSPTRHIAALFVALAGLALAGPARGGEPAPLLEGDLGPIPQDVLDLSRVPLADQEARSLFEQVRRRILEHHADREVSEADLYLAATVGMLDLLNRRAPHRASDPHGILESNALLGAEALSSAEALRRGEKTGVGVEFQPASPLGGILVVQRVFPGSAAAKRGLQAGDRILAIDGHPLKDAPLRTVLGMLSGAAGTPIHLRVHRPRSAGGTFGITLTRGTYRVSSVAVAYPAPGVAHVQVSHFNGLTAKDLQEALGSARAAGIDRVVLDLRNNPGGLLGPAAAVAELFLSPGQLIGRLEDASERGRDLVARVEDGFRGRLVCLVNRFTTSAAELVASALQDNGRAALVGEPTMGKGSTDTLTVLRPGLALRLTTTRLLRVLGGTWEDEGLTPDVSVAAYPSPDGVAPQLDPVLSAALGLIDSDEGEGWVAPARKPPVRNVRTTP
ncbi:S41 family peptidase [Myxococcota bacterium]|nr:S41 family peptidase [Myxococcota bacterium]